MRGSGFRKRLRRTSQMTRGVIWFNVAGAAACSPGRRRRLPRSLRIDLHLGQFCLEAQADHHLAVISVVTRVASDDATSFPVNGSSIDLKIAEAGGAIFFYESEDGKTWGIVRKFNLQPADGWLAGFFAQSPEGNGADALFTDLHYLPEKPNLWNLL